MSEKIGNVYIENSNNSIFEKYGIFARKSVLGNSYPLHIHDYYELEYIARGKGTHTVNGVIKEMAEGTLYLVTPRDIHRIEVEEEMLIYSFFFDADLIPREISSLLSACQSFIGVRCTDKMKECAEYLSRHITDAFSKISSMGFYGEEVRKSDIGGLFLCSGALLDILINNGAFEAPSEKESRSLAISMQNALRYINKNFRAPLSLGSVADEVGYSKSHFSRVFAKYVGCNFIDYVKEKRLKSAALLLRTTEMNASDIAFSCGYGSVSQFIRDFKAFYSESPGDYRKGQKNND